MHEYVFADKILQSVLEETRGRKRGPLVIRVEVGEMLGLTRESLTSAFAVLSKGTRVETAKLQVRFTKGSVECPRCGFTGRLKLERHEHGIDPAFACPDCGSSLRVQEGLEAKLIAVE
ncbi:MAG: hydrogenase maturation nickel metallochaperone HypA [Thaumarchaeota archaeon]|nr:hydrogenase maturation nickel metallochaperone HypA [Nitrososphaerota archaeon]